MCVNNLPKDQGRYAKVTSSRKRQSKMLRGEIWDI